VSRGGKLAGWHGERGDWGRRLRP